MVRRATLKDVAELAGVSTATVARVLHNNGYVASETRGLVERAIAETGYQINAIAQGLRRQRTYTIGHVLHSIIPNQFFAAVAEGVEEVASRHGCGVLITNTHGDPERERQAVQTLIQRRVDAIVFTTATHVDNVRLAARSGVPIVQVERMTSVETPSVTADNFGGAHAAVQHLILLGHRRIAFLGVDPARMRARPGSASHPDVEQERLSGYLAALADHRVAEDPRLVALGGSYYDDFESASLPKHQIVQSLLETECPPTAIFATSDLFAAAALQTIAERGLRVPRDISVIGFDGTYAPYLTPPLTAVENPMLDMGRFAAQLVFQRLGESASSQPGLGHRLPMTLKVRASTAPPGG